jgi:hypothetical protein
MEEKIDGATSSNESSLARVSVQDESSTGLTILIESIESQPASTSSSSTATSVTTPTHRLRAKQINMLFLRHATKEFFSLGGLGALIGSLIAFLGLSVIYLFATHVIRFN